jgi:hypothetical protein
VASRDTAALPSLDVVTIKGFCQHSRHEGETGHADGSDLGYATVINSINYTEVTQLSSTAPELVERWSGL